MAERPYTVLSCAMSLDGYLAGAEGEPLPLSSAADLDRVDAVRASCDAVLVGAATVRHDNCRLLVRSPTRRLARTSRGLPASPTKVTVTAGGELDAGAAFFVAGDTRKLVYCATAALDRTRGAVGALATVVDGGQPVDLRWLSEDLYDRGVRRLLVEGGGTIHTQFLTCDLVDELHVVVAPFFVGDARARRFVGDGRFPWGPQRRAVLAEVRRLDDVVLLQYALSTRFRPDQLQEV
nr:dihydrofolate reductase family protein [uncultured Friedmanniella sp.]